MNTAAKIWWNQSRQRALVAAIGQQLQSGALVLQLPSPAPWGREFRQAVVRSLSGERTLRELCPAPGTQPEPFLLHEVCPPEVRFTYWPNRSFAQFLAENPALPFHSSCIWVRGIDQAPALTAWASFAAQYQKAAAHLAQKACFILEYSQSDTPAAALPCLRYAPGRTERRIFCLELAALNASPCPEYLAQLALCLGDTPEACERLLAQPEKLLQAPAETAKELLPELKADSLESRIWLAQTATLFVPMEQWRQKILQKYEVELLGCLPMHSAGNEPIRCVEELEFGQLYFLKDSILFEPQDFQTLILCRTVRNLLAHNTPVCWQKARAVLNLTDCAEN